VLIRRRGQRCFRGLAAGLASADEPCGAGTIRRDFRRLFRWGRPSRLCTLRYKV